MTTLGLDLGAAAGAVLAFATTAGVRSKQPSVRRTGSPASWRGPGGSAIGWPALGSRARGGTDDRAGPGSWARRRDVRALLVSAEQRGRLRIGAFAGWTGGRMLAAEPQQSVAVVGPTQSGKTTAVAVPAILGWDGPVVAASVKTDLVRDTLAWRRQCGRVWCFDPARTTGLPADRWSPLAAAHTWAGARRLAADLAAVTRVEATTSDGEFWYATAAKLLAPLLFAAAATGGTMRDVVRWVDTQEMEEVADVLEAAGAVQALQSARATWLRDERQRSAVYTTAETVLEPFVAMSEDEGRRADVGFADAATQMGDQERTDVRGARADRGDTPPFGVPAVSRGAVRGGDIDADALLLGRHTLYLCAPAHDQRRLRALFVSLVEQVLRGAFVRASQLGGPLDPPLLVVLDEAANIAPLSDLDGLAATCAGHGVQLVTVWQDLAQVRARYGERAATVVNNHRAKLFLPGIADPGTLDFASHLAGEREVPVQSVSVSAGGDRTVTTSTQTRRLLSADALRRLRPGSAVLLYGSLPPVRVALRPWFSDRMLARRGARGAGAAGGSGGSGGSDGGGGSGGSGGSDGGGEAGGLAGAYSRPMTHGATGAGATGAPPEVQGGEAIEGRAEPRAPDRPHTLAIDVGGTGLKASVLDAAGAMVADRVRVPTSYPMPPTGAGGMVPALAALVATLPEPDRVSVGFPGMVRGGLVLSAPHFVTKSGPGSEVDPGLVSAWRRFDLAGALREVIGKPTRVANDADVQGLASVVGSGLELVITLGTGFGTALFLDGSLMPHLEIAHQPFRKGQTYNEQLGERARKEVGDERWNRRLRKAIVNMAGLFVYDHLFIGGGNGRRVDREGLGAPGAPGAPGALVTIVDNTAGILGGIKLWEGKHLGV